MENSTIVTLSPSTSIQAVTFEEAFGEFSEARGRGQARRAERQAARQERKAARIAARQEKKAQKQAARQERRLQRQEAKSARQEVKQSRRTNRLAARVERRKMRRPDEDETQMDESTTAMQDSAPISESQPTNDGYGNGEGTAESDDNAAQSKYSEDVDGNEPSEVEQDEADVEDGGDDEDSGFNGSSFDYEYADATSFSNEAIDNTERTAAEIVTRIKANEIFISRIRKKLDEIRKAMNQRLTEQQRANLIAQLNEFKALLEKRTNRLIELQSQLDAYSGANGRRSRGRRRMPVRRRVRRHKPTVTEVEAGLNADIKKGRIEVPAAEMSSANGIEMYATDSTDEFDSPQDRVIELKSGFDGNVSVAGKKINLGYVAIGVGLAALAIYGLKKLK